MKYIFILIILFPLALAHAVPLVPGTAVNRDEQTCFTYMPGNECGISVLPEGWEHLDWSTCPAEYRIIPVEERPALGWKKNPNAPLHCEEGVVQLDPYLFAVLPGILVGLFVVLFWFKKSESGSE